MIYTRQAEDLPSGVKGFILHDENDDYTIFLNDRLGRIMNLETFNHEMDHIDCDDIYATDTADYIEKTRHE